MWEPLRHCATASLSHVVGITPRVNGRVHVLVKMGSSTKYPIMPRNLQGPERSYYIGNDGEYWEVPERAQVEQGWNAWRVWKWIDVPGKWLRLADEPRTRWWWGTWPRNVE